MTGLSEPFMIPYVLALGGTAFQSGLLASARNLLLAGVQLKAADAVAWSGGRLPLVLRTTAVQGLLWVPMAFAAPLFGGWAVIAVIALYTVGTASAALGSPAWGSLVSEYLSEGERGRFFGERARTVGLSATVATFVGGGILQLTDRRPVVGFALLVLAAAVARAGSWHELRQLHEDPWREHPRLRFTFWQFIRQVGRSNFARFSCCLAALNLSSHIAAPFFAVYMLEELHFGYLHYTLVVLAGSITGFLTSAWWGGLGDRIGNHAVLRWTVVAVAPLPALWAVVPSPFWLGMMNVLGAFLWAGLNLASVNYLYDAVSPPKRHTCLAYFNVLNGAGIAVGAAFGGVLVDRLPRVTGENPFVEIFVVSAVCRALAGFAFAAFVREIRDVRPVGLREVVVDEVGQRLEQVLGFFSVRPEREFPKRPMLHRVWRRARRRRR